MVLDRRTFPSETIMNNHLMSLAWQFPVGHCQFEINFTCMDALSNELVRCAHRLTKTVLHAPIQCLIITDLRGISNSSCHHVNDGSIGRPSLHYDNRSNTLFQSSRQSRTYGCHKSGLLNKAKRYEDRYIPLT